MVPLAKTESEGDPGADQRLAASHPVIDEWLQAVNTRSVSAVCTLYAHDAILLPTLADEICDTPGRIKAYFDVFLRRPTLKVRLVSCYVQEYSEIKIDSGIYEFEWKDEDSGSMQTTRARFTFVIRDGSIVEHHSSMTPGFST